MHYDYFQDDLTLSNFFMYVVKARWIDDDDRAWEKSMT